MVIKIEIYFVEGSMKILIILGSGDYCKVRTAIKLGIAGLKVGDEVSIAFLNCCPDKNVLDLENMGLSTYLKKFLSNGGKFFSFAKAVLIEKCASDGAFPIEKIEKIYQMVKAADKVLEIW